MITSRAKKYWNCKQNFYCDGRESNPGQLLGRQLCSPLYHRRLCQPDVRLNQHLVTSVATMDWPWRLLETTLPSIMTPWRNGSASDSRSEGCVFESRRGQTFFLDIKVGVVTKWQNAQRLPWPGFEPGLSRPQREVLTTIRSRPYRQLSILEFKLRLILVPYHIPLDLVN